MKNKQQLYIVALGALLVGAYFLWAHTYSADPISANRVESVDVALVEETQDNDESSATNTVESAKTTLSVETQEIKESPTTNENRDLVVRYGVIRRNSTSGELRLSYYDVKQKKVLQSWQGYPWFFATPEDIEDREGANKQFDYVESNSGSVFKIVGTKDPEDDCSYYGNIGPCLENIIIKTIEAVAK